MKIVRKRADRPLQPHPLWWLLAVAALVGGLLLGRAGALDAVQQLWQNVLTVGPTAANGSLPVLGVDMSFANYNDLLRQRERALNDGVLFAADADFFPADVQVDGQQIPVRLRLLPQAARHLGENEQWNFELQTRDNQLLLGHERLNLLDPADNNGLAEWAFMATLEREGLPAAAYSFAQMILNGDTRGTYAVQEGSGPLLARGAGQPPHVIAGYDTTPLWEAVSYYGGDLEAALADPVTSFASNDLRFVPVDTSRDPLVTADETLAAQLARAQALLLALQRGESAAAEVFDVAAYGRFLALADLWGAPGVLSPFNLRYVYDPASDRLIPIGRHGNALATDARIPLAATYQDPQIQAAYAQAAAHYSDPAYLEELRGGLEPALAALARDLGATGEAEAIWAELGARQQVLRRSLRPAQPVIAQLGPPERAQEAIIEVRVANAVNLPLEILGFDIDGATFLEVDPAWITAGAEHVAQEDGRVVLNPPPPGAPRGLNFVTFDLPVTEILKQDSELDFLNEMTLQVATRVLGLEETQLTPAAAGVRQSAP